MKLIKRDWEYAVTWAKKIKAIELLGGKCEKCGNNDIFCLCFHHVGKKESGISYLTDGRWSLLEKELKKCMLLCQNCHAELHNPKESLAKKKLVEIKGSNQCSKCGYVAENLSALDFHHDKREKNFMISEAYQLDKITRSMNKVLNELSLCSVVCKNCHIKMQINIERFNKFKNIIYEKVNVYKEIQPKIDRKIIKKLFDGGIGVVAISKKLGCCKSTISMALKKINMV